MEFKIWGACFIDAVAGIGDQCSNKGMAQFTEQLSNWSNSEGHCVYDFDYFDFC